MREQFRQRIIAGETGEQLIASYVAEHGEQIRISPTATGFNLVAWLGPVAALFIAATVMILVLRRWRRTAPVTAMAPAAPPPADDEYLARVRRELKEMQ
jgi:cytochrome c-type biogenesis protein CcmH/NrfF